MTSKFEHEFTPAHVGKDLHERMVQLYEEYSSKDNLIHLKMYFKVNGDAVLMKDTFSPPIDDFEGLGNRWPIQQMVRNWYLQNREYVDKTQDLKALLHSVNTTASNMYYCVLVGGPNNGSLILYDPDFPPLLNDPEYTYEAYPNYNCELGVRVKRHHSVPRNSAVVWEILSATFLEYHKIHGLYLIGLFDHIQFDKFNETDIVLL